MKRALSLILSVLFLLTAMPLGMVSAATDAVVKGALDKTTVAYGDTVTLSVSMENNPGLVCWAVDVDYDTTVLELIEQTPGDAYAGIGTLAFGPTTKSSCNVLWYDFLNEDVTNNGHLFSFTFKVKSGAAVGKYPITLHCIDPENMCNAAFEAVPFSYESPVVEIVECIHQYSSQEQAPTCGAEGAIVYTCGLCGDTYSEPIPATGEHTFDKACDTECNVCGATREVGDHVYDSTCDEVCNECGALRVADAHLYENAAAPVCIVCGAALDIASPIVYAVADHARVVRGDKVTVAVAMQQNPGLVGWQFLLNYDDAVLTPIEVTAGDAFANVEFGPVENVPFSAIWLDALNGNNAANGVLYYVTFEVKADAAYGITTLAVEYADPDNVFDNDLNVVSFAVAESGVEVVDHIHVYEGVVTTEPTCGAEGVKTYTCSICGDSYTEAIPATGEHTYEGVVTTEPTCVDEGVKTYTCSVCGDSYTEAIPATGEHTYDNDCDAACNVCGYIREVVHLYENADAPVCAFCGAALDIAAPILYTTTDNPYVARGDKVTVAVSMQQNPGLVGWQLLLNYDAAVLAPIEVTAGDAFENVEFGPVENVPFSAIWLDALNGNNTANGVLYYVTFEVKADAAYGITALSVGLVDADGAFDEELSAVSFAVAKSGIRVLDHTHVYDNACDAECNECGYVREVGEHTYEGVVTTEPTCVDEGVKTYTCSICGDSYTEAIPATGEHTYEGVVTTEPTCVDEGVKTYTCSICGDSYTEAIPATDEHTYEGVVTTEPTCGAEGVKTYTCSVCGDSYTEAIPATGDHVYDGDYDADCNVCGAIREVDVLLGDVNGDGKFNVRDIGLMQQWMNSWDVSMIEAAADVNCDGKINVRDIGLMQQKMNGWNVEFGPQDA